MKSGKILERRKWKKVDSTPQLPWPQSLMLQHVNPEGQVQPRAHHPLQTASKDEHIALLSSSFAIAWKGKMKTTIVLKPQVEW